MKEYTKTYKKKSKSNRTYKVSFLDKYHDKDVSDAMRGQEVIKMVNNNAKGEATANKGGRTYGISSRKDAIHTCRLPHMG